MTPDELLKLTPQKVFTLAAKHLIKQGRQAWNHTVDNCAYRGMLAILWVMVR